MRSGVVIVGAGMGTRLGLGVRKAMVPVLGIPLIVHAARAFLGHPDIGAVVLVTHPDDQVLLRAGAYANELKSVIMVLGGERRQDSVLNGLKALPKDLEGVLVHDAARPFVSAATIAAVAKALDSAPCAVPCVPLTSTIKRVDAEGRVLETVDRSTLFAAQTPQGGRRAILAEALSRASCDGWEVTDDMQALERMGYAALVVRDSTWNFKVTTPMDLRIAEWVAEAKPWQKE